MALPAYLLCAFLLVAVLMYLWRHRRQLPPLPPSPPGDPLIGHLRVLPPVDQVDIFQEWAAQYGDMFSLNILGQSIVVLNKYQAAVELLEKRSANFSDRPKCVSYDLMGWKRSSAVLPYGPTWRKHRKMFQEYLTAQKCVGYQDMQEQEAQILLKNILAACGAENLTSKIQRYATSTIMQLAYGHQVISDDDEYLKIAEAASHSVAAANPGATPVDFFPFLQYCPSWLPGCSSFTSSILRWRPMVEKFMNFPLAQVQLQLDAGVANPCFAATQLERLNHQAVATQEDFDDIKGASGGGVLFIAGVESTTSSLLTFLLAMTIFPEVQRKAQEEIDRVIGGDRLPQFGDRKALPYTECVLQETMRWHSAFPVGVPHRSLEDDIYNGMFIPKGSLVFANASAMSRDESIYKNAWKYYPDRFFPAPLGYGEKHLNAAFGFGRRICPGRHFADASAWIAMASIFATMNITRAIGEDGREIIPEAAFTPSITSHPKPFACVLKPRSEKAESLIMHAE